MRHDELNYHLIKTYSPIQHHTFLSTFSALCFLLQTSDRNRVIVVLKYINIPSIKNILYTYLRSERSSFGLLSSFNASEKASLAALKSSRWNSAILRINNSNKLSDHNIIIFIYLNFLCVLVIMRIKNVNLEHS